MNNNILDVQDYWIDLKEVAELKGVNPRTVRLQKNKYIKREKSVRGGKTYEFLLTSLEPEIQEKFLQKYYNRISFEEIDQPLMVIEPPREDLIIPEVAKQQALAKFDLVNLWQDFVKDKQKVPANNEFLELYNTGLYAETIFKKIGKVSIGTLHRWKKKLGRTNDYTNLVSRSYSLTGEFKTSLTDLEKNILMRLLLNPRCFSIGKAINMTIYILNKKGFEDLPAPITFKRYVDWFKKNNYDKWILAREGEKALRDKVEPFLIRDAKILNVLDVLVADGHVLNFQIKNPFTGRPARATLIGFLDWRSGALAGYEIMLEENTQAIASALRNAILNIGAIPKIVYQDNGRAFKSKFFQGDVNFTEAGFQGLYSKLGIKSVFAKPYNAQSKVIERFFLEFQESFEKMLPSYIGTSIQNKPAYLKRNEKFHKSIHNDYVPTIQEAMRMIDCWIEYRNSQPCSIEPDKTIAEVLATVKKEKINLQELDDLMLAQKKATIYRNGIKFLNTYYFDDKLYGFRDKVLIKYSLFDLSEIKVYSMRGKFICTAKRVLPTHPMAYQMGGVKDVEDYKQKIQKKAKLRKRTIKSVEKYLDNDEIKFLEDEMKLDDINQLTDDLNPVNELLISDKTEPKVFKNNFERYDYLQRIASREHSAEKKLTKCQVFREEGQGGEPCRADSFSASNQDKTRKLSEEETAWLAWYRTTNEFKEVYEK